MALRRVDSLGALNGGLEKQTVRIMAGSIVHCWIEGNWPARRQALAGLCARPSQAACCGGADGNTNKIRGCSWEAQGAADQGRLLLWSNCPPRPMQAWAWPGRQVQAPAQQEQRRQERWRRVRRQRRLPGRRPLQSGRPSGGGCPPQPSSRPWCWARSAAGQQRAAGKEQRAGWWQVEVAAWPCLHVTRQRVCPTGHRAYSAVAVPTCPRMLHPHILPQTSKRPPAAGGAPRPQTARAGRRQPPAAAAPSRGMP